MFINTVVAIYSERDDISTLRLFFVLFNSIHMSYIGLLLIPIFVTEFIVFSLSMSWTFFVRRTRRGLKLVSMGASQVRSISSWCPPVFRRYIWYQVAFIGTMTTIEGPLTLLHLHANCMSRCFI